MAHVIVQVNGRPYTMQCPDGEEAHLRDLAKLGAKLAPRPPFDHHMGSYQQAWRDEQTGLLSASTDPRRAGEAGGF